MATHALLLEHERSLDTDVTAITYGARQLFYTPLSLESPRHFIRSRYVNLNR